MISPSISRSLGFAVGAGTALTAFGLAAPANAVVDCSAGVTVNANEQEIRDAITANETLICVNPGTIDLSSSGTDSDASPIEITEQDLTLIALGDVTFDGGNETNNAIILHGGASEDLTVDGFTFTGFDNDWDDPWGTVSLSQSNGTLTVLNSTFTDNYGYAMVSAIDPAETDRPADVVVDNSVFDHNDTISSQVWAKADVTVTNSTFTNSDGTAIGIENELDADTTAEIHGNYFGDNVNDGALVGTYAELTLLYNNTFANNELTYADNGIAFQTWGPGGDVVVAANTFDGNFYDGASESAVFVTADYTATIIGNVFVNDVDDYAVVADVADDVTDAGGNFSTSDDSAILDDATSHNSVDAATLHLGDPADNGGATWTEALGANSVAIDAVPAAAMQSALGFALDVDQRGEDRDSTLDAGAFEFPEALANTGVDATGIALTGGVLGAAGVALVARRRRKA